MAFALYRSSGDDPVDLVSTMRLWCTVVMRRQREFAGSNVYRAVVRHSRMDRSGRLTKVCEGRRLVGRTTMS